MAVEDPDLFATWVEEIQAREELEAKRNLWTTQDELLAQVVEFLSVQYVSFIGANTKKGTKLPDVHRVPRPGQSDPNEAKRMSPRQMARRMMGR